MKLRPIKLGHTRDGVSFTASVKELSTHLLVVGGSGRGKSVLFDHIIRQITPQTGCFILDPHGSLAEYTVSFLAEHQPERRVHLIEPRNQRWTTGFNPLAFSRDNLTEGVESVVTAFSAAWGHEDLHERPRLRRVLTAMLYMLAACDLSLADAVTVFAPGATALRKRLVERLPHEFFRHEWDEFNSMKPVESREFFESALNRLGPFLSSERILAMLGQTDHVIDFRPAMDSRELVVANLAPSKSFTAGNAQVVGTLLLNAITQHALLRDTVNPAPFFALVDEANRFLSRDCETLLDQTRKFGVFLTLSLQRLGQLAEKGEAIASAVRGIQSKVVFGGLSVEDATALADELFIGTHDLQKTKDRITTPVTVGHELKWLITESESETESDQWSDSQADDESESAGTSTQVDAETMEALPITGVTSSTGKRRSAAHTTGGGKSSARTHGRHEAHVPKLEERATQTYSLQEHLHVRAAELKKLPVGQAVVKILDRPATYIRIPAPRKTRSDARTQFYCAQLHARSPSAMRTSDALAAITKRQAELITPPRDDASEPVYGRRTSRPKKDTT